MADFVSTSVTKSAKRTLTTKWAAIADFNTLMASILSGNPWGCTSYTSGGETLAGIRKTKEYVAGKVVYEDVGAKQVGYISVNAPSSTAFNSDISTILATAAIETAMGGTGSHDSSEDNFSTTFTCHDANGEVYKVQFTRSSVTVSGFEADSILAAIETWADNQAALA